MGAGIRTTPRQHGPFPGRDGALDRILEEAPTFRAAIQVRAPAPALDGRVEEADEPDRVVAMTGDSYRWLAERGSAYALPGRTDDARRNLETLREKQRMHPELPLEIDFCILLIGPGDYEEARTHLERSAEKRPAGVLFMVNSSPGYLAREDPGFDEFLELPH